MNMEHDKFLRVISMDEPSARQFAMEYLGVKTIVRIVDVGEVDINDPYYARKYRPGARHFHIYTRHKDLFEVVSLNEDKG